MNIRCTWALLLLAVLLVPLTAVTVNGGNTEPGPGEMDEQYELSPFIDEQGSGHDRGTEYRVYPEEPEALRTILNVVQPGDRIIVTEGVYRYKTTIPLHELHDLTIAGEGEAWILTGNVDAPVLALSSCANLTITNLHLQHEEPIAEYQCHGAVLDITDCRDIAARGCELAGCGAIGVKAGHSEGLTIDECHIHLNTFNAFYFDHVSTIGIHNNRIVNNANFMQAYTVDGLEMYGNTCFNNKGYWDAME